MKMQTSKFQENALFYGYHSQIRGALYYIIEKTILVTPYYFMRI